MKLYKFRALKPSGTIDTEELIERILDIVNRHRLYCQNWRNFDDQREGAYRSFANITPEILRKIERAISGHNELIKDLYVEKRSACDNVGVCSLTLGPLESKRLWKSYGGEGCGVAIEFELKSEQVKPPLYIVKYAEKEENNPRTLLKALSDVNGDISRMTESLLTWKGCRYKDENEVRFICRQCELEAILPKGCALPTLEAAMRNLDAIERKKEYYLDYTRFLELKKVWCGKDVSDADFCVLKEAIHCVPVARIQ